MVCFGRPGGGARQVARMAEFNFSFESIVANTNDIVIVTKADQVNEPGPETARHIGGNGYGTRAADP